jgi:hypothetical protein
MASFSYLKHKQKNLEFAQQHFGIQSLFWIKINFDPTVRWKGLDTINVHRINSTAIGFHVCGTLPNKRKLKN